MLLVIPVSEADAQLAQPLVEVLTALGPYPLHDLLVVASHENANAAQELNTALSPYFRSTDTYLFACPAKGWPAGPNAYFRATVSHIFSTGLLTQPWYWFEMDVTPLKAGWLDALQTEYNLNDAIFMGVKHPTYYTRNGELVTQGEHMCGAGIYPFDFVRRSVLWRYEENVAFDIWLQWEILPHLRDTKLMNHNWKTINYRRENGVIVCDSVELIHPDLVFNKPITAEAVTCHGCKDSSLAKLVLSELKLNEVADQEPLDAQTHQEELGSPKSRKRKKESTMPS